MQESIENAVRSAAVRQRENIKRTSKKSLCSDPFVTTLWIPFGIYWNFLLVAVHVSWLLSIVTFFRRVSFSWFGWTTLWIALHFNCASIQRCTPDQSPVVRELSFWSQLYGYFKPLLIAHSTDLDISLFIVVKNVKFIAVRSRRLWKTAEF